MKFIIEEKDLGKQKVTVKKEKAVMKFKTKGYFTSLELVNRGDDYLYEWNHGGGSGEFVIPADVIYDIPSLLLCLSEAVSTERGLGIMNKVRIYKSKSKVADY